MGKEESPYKQPHEARIPEQHSYPIGAPYRRSLQFELSKVHNAAPRALLSMGGLPPTTQDIDHGHIFVH